MNNFSKCPACVGNLMRYHTCTAYQNTRTSFNFPYKAISELEEKIEKISRELATAIEKIAILEQKDKLGGNHE